VASYLYTSLTPGTLANGRPVGFDDEIELSADEAKDEYNAALIEDGRLLPTKAVKASKTAAEKEKEE
jgi:hypothetical protein